MTTALFAGSFNPFTKGHLRIVERALKIADKVVVAIGTNIAKEPENDSIEKRINAIKEATGFLGEAVEVCAYHGLTAEFARQTGADFLLRGIRSVSDFEYERNLADINLKILGMETVLLIAEPEYSFISSSAVRELSANGHDISSLLP